MSWDAGDLFKSVSMIMMSWFPAHCVHPIVGRKNVKDSSKHKTLIVLGPERHSKNSASLFSAKPASCRQTTAEGRKSKGEGLISGESYVPAEVGLQTARHRGESTPK